jgi:crotonobetainyl-CoA:carnitine CoA-transferase CaiB-like acyl-CoA transferase
MSDAAKKCGPLAGYRVLEMGSTISGPFCGRLLADFGAEVIKVEPPEGDPLRKKGRHYHDISLYAATIFRNKSTIAVNLRTPEGQEVIRKLASHCDIVVENFRPGALERWGIGYEHLSAINPGIVMIRISGYGQTGPYSQFGGFGIICEGIGGLRNLTGDPDRPPSRVAVSLTDCLTAVYACFGAVMALLHQEKTGEGQMIDAALYESAFSFMEPHVTAYDKLGVVAKRSGTTHSHSVVNNTFATKDQQFIHIAASSDYVFPRLAKAIGRPDLLDDERYAKAIARTRHAGELDDIVARWTAQYDMSEAQRLLHEADVPAMGIYTMADIFADPHFRARDMLVEMRDPELGTVTVPGVVPKLSKTPGAVRHTGHRIGEDTHNVLTKIAGMTNKEVDTLTAAGVIVCRKPSEKESAA